jgi:hypothetical protein
MTTTPPVPQRAAVSLRHQGVQPALSRRRRQARAAHSARPPAASLATSAVSSSISEVTK